MFSGLRLAADVARSTRIPKRGQLCRRRGCRLSAWHKAAAAKYFYDTSGPPVSRRSAKQTTTTSPARDRPGLADIAGNLRPAFRKVQSWWSSAAETAPRHAAARRRPQLSAYVRSILARRARRARRLVRNYPKLHIAPSLRTSPDHSTSALRKDIPESAFPRITIGNFDAWRGCASCGWPADPGRPSHLLSGWTCLKEKPR